MANVIQIKRGTTTPTTTNLPNDGEMAYDKTGKKLYINNGGTIDSIGGVGWSTNTDTKMTQAYSTTSNSYPMLLCATAGISSTSSRGATTGILNNQLYANPNTGLLHATTMEGKGTVAYGSTAPNAANHDFWVDTSTTGSIPAAYGVANNLTTASAGSYALDAYQGKVLSDKIDNLYNYSTVEQVIGTWIDGKLLYRKVLTQSCTGASSYNLNHGISNFGLCVNADVYIYSAHTTHFGSNTPYPFKPYHVNDVAVHITDVASAYATGWTILAIIEYTKTTD